MIEKFNANTAGNDYICSDIHGHYSLLEQALATLGFDESKDRLFSLGDLIDRGDESTQALEWLNKPWFHAIQGNHERMLINAFESQSNMLFHQWFAWGGHWAEDMDIEEIEVFYRAFIQCPIAIELELSNGKHVALVHAELPDSCNWDDVRQLLKTTDPKLAESTLVISNMLWNKAQPFYPAEKIENITNVENIDHTFHGHTIVGDYVTLANRTFMDLGSYKTGKIGIVNPVEFLSGV